VLKTQVQASNIFLFDLDFVLNYDGTADKIHVSGFKQNSCQFLLFARI